MVEQQDIETLIELNQDLSVLYVEDDDSVRFSTLALLENFFPHIDPAEDGVVGLEKYKRFYEEESRFYDIVITDINMPHMNGIEMSEEILKINPEQNIIVISAHDESHYLLKLINAGITNFVLKPIDLKQLQNVLYRVLSAIQQKRTLKEQHERLESINKELEEQKNRAEEASRQKSLFLANMSHEIRTPLNAITGFISLLQKEETNPRRIKYLDIIQNSSSSLLQIINDILDISKIESGKMEVEFVDFNPYNDLITVAELFQQKATEKGVVLEIKYNHTMPKTLFSDVVKIKQILSNLLSNAVKFTPAGKKIKCIIWYQHGKLNIRVKDYGIGIDEEKQKSIFQAFVQAENSTVREYGGTGLGLTICAKLAEMLEGSLTLESTPGKGSTFLLSIPVEERTYSDDEKETPLPEKLDGHILVVDDTETNRMFISILLENVGLTYDMANDGLEAIEQFKKNRYDLILMDENMPNLNGTGAAKVIMEMEKEQGLTHTPVISLTANALKGDRERFLQAGMDDYLSKPINPDTLLRLLAKFL